MAPVNDRRRPILTDTICQTNSIVSHYQDAQDSIFLNKQLTSFEESNLPLDKGRNEHILATGAGHERVLSGDAFVVAHKLLNNNAEYFNKVLVLNSCSDVSPGGGIEQKLGNSHEEQLIYCSTFLYTLKKQAASYPFNKHTIDGKKTCGIYSPAVVIFKDELKKDSPPLSQKGVVSVISVAAPKDPTTTGINDVSKVEELIEKLILVMRVAVRKRKTIVVLSPLGCGEHGWKSDVVAKHIKEVIEMDEFGGLFDEIVIAIQGHFEETVVAIQGFSEKIVIAIQGHRAIFTAFNNCFKIDD